MPPQIVVPPANQTIQVGGSVTFLCVATGLPNPSIAWLRESTLLESNSRIIPSGNLLQISDAVVDDTNDYTCRATNPAGTDEESARLIVFSKLELS